MRWNIAAEAISLVMLGIIWVYARKGSHLPTLKNRVFQGCLMVTFGAMLTNILSTIMIYNYQSFPLWMTWIVTTAYFILTPLMGMAYFLYTVSVIYTEYRLLKRAIGLGIIPGAVYMVLILSNTFTGNVFSVSEGKGYERGPLIFTTYLIFYIYCAVSIVFTFVNHKRIEGKIYRILAAFPILAVLVIIVQQIFPDIILSGSAATCALLNIYLYLQNRQISMDYLTNVPNRQELLDMLELMLKKAPEKKFVLAVVSLRDFRQLNNSFGQLTGDRFLREFSRFLCEIGPNENVYRFNGDEFALLFTHENRQEMKHCMDQICERMDRPWQVEEYCCSLSAVIGVICYAGKEESLEKIINSIEYAVFQAKTGKYGQICYCNEGMLKKLERRRQIIRILKEKLADQSFEMYYQPIYSLKNGDFPHAESLMRIPDSPVGPIYPSEFIPIAEETGMIIEITYVILDKVCKFINRLTEENIPIGSIHVNFSAIQFSQPGLAKKVLDIIRENKTPMHAVKIEFTESTLAESTQVVTDFALEMMRHGIKMGLDDFGTGYSNISTVINIPFGTMKLDKSLVWGAMDKEQSALVVRNLTQTFKQLGMSVIAEGVENEEQKNLVEYFGVDEIQGFYYARPMPADEMEEFMRNIGAVKNDAS